MKVIILTESQVERLLIEQSELSFDRRFGTAAAAEKTNAGNKQMVNAAYNGLLKMDPHTRNDILAFATSFAGEAGPYISSGIAQYDASLYWKEGKKKEAALTYFLSMLPYASDLKIFKTIGSKGMAILSEKILMNRELTQIEMQALKTIESSPKLRELVKDYIKEKAADATYDAAGNLIKKTTQALAPNANKIAARAVSNTPKGLSNIPKALSNAPKLAYNNTNLIGKGRKV